MINPIKKIGELGFAIHMSIDQGGVLMGLIRPRREEPRDYDLGNKMIRS
jgi:hypothetical protein